jgi:hypothetical protein
MSGDSSQERRDRKARRQFRRVLRSACGDRKAWRTIACFHGRQKSTARRRRTGPLARQATAAGSSPDRGPRPVVSARTGTARPSPVSSLTPILSAPHQTSCGTRSTRRWTLQGGCSSSRHRRHSKRYATETAKNNRTGYASRMTRRARSDSRAGNNAIEGISLRRVNYSRTCAL